MEGGVMSISHWGMFLTVDDVSLKDNWNRLLFDAIGKQLDAALAKIETLERTPRRMWPFG